MVSAEDEPTTHEGLIHPALIAAYERCGFLLTEMNMHLMTPDQIAEWEAAIDDWTAEHPDEDPP
jgi:hypothetical protein